MCKLCETNPVYEFTNKRKLCRRCFVSYFQKKVLYTIRKFGMIRLGDVIGYRKLNDFRNVVLEEVLKMFSEKANVKLVKFLSKKKVNKIADASTIDGESNKFVHEIILGSLKGINKIKPVDKNVIRPLYLFLDKEVLLYAKLRGLKFKKEKVSLDKIGKFIEESEKKHPEIKRAIVNSFLKLNG